MVYELKLKRLPCLICLEDFLQIHGNQRYCCDACRVIKRRKKDQARSKLGQTFVHAGQYLLWGSHAENMADMSFRFSRS